MAAISYGLEFHNIQCYLFFRSELLQMNKIEKEPCLAKYSP